ncbi:MAG: flagellar hook-length control protein FliK [Phycisphaerales bacterium]|nr:flagellar hook-length control protein FliK [Phycisphaerales bacterium]
MYPALTSLVSPPDPYAGGSAPVSQVISRDLLADFKEFSSGNEPLSDAIERQIEDRDIRNQLLEAQEDHDVAQEIAQESPVEADGVAMISGSGNGSAPTSGHAMNSGSPMGPHGSGPVRSGIEVDAGRQVQSSPVVSSKPAAAPTAMAVSSGGLRHVPAAVLRAIEVESSLQIGVKNSSTGNSNTRANGSLQSGARNMAPSELRTLQGMTSLLAQRGGRIRIQLEPLQLGPVTIDVDVHGARVRADIETSTRAAQRVLEAATSRLRASLESQGYTLERLDVRPEGSSGSPAAATDSQEEEQQHSRKTNEDDRSRHERHSSNQKSAMVETHTFAEAEQDIAIQEQNS